jgi:hypothetical protein
MLVIVVSLLVRLYYRLIAGGTRGGAGTISSDVEITRYDAEGLSNEVISSCVIADGITPAATGII